MSLKNHHKRGQKKVNVQITDDLLYSLLEVGVVTALVAAPWMAVMTLAYAKSKKDKPTQRQSQNTLGYMRRRGYIHVESKKGQVSITLTQKGRERAIKSFVRAAPQRSQGTQWDGKWRVLIYDVAEDKRLVRDVLRTFIKKSGFVKLQGSIWIYPHDCGNEVQRLKEYLGLSDEECRLVVSDDIGDDKQFRKRFGV